MGVIYKLTPKIRDFILKEKASSPQLSCRKLSALVNETFRIEISKSHVNALMKLQGISNRVGRPVKPKKGLTEGQGLGAYMLKAVDALTGESQAISHLLKEALPDESDTLAISENLLYSSLLGDLFKDNFELGKLTEKPLAEPGRLASHLDLLQQVTTLRPRLWETIRDVFKPVLGVKISFSNGSSFILDGQFHTLWQSAGIPFHFSTTYFKIKSYINNYLNQSSPLVLMTAPGYDQVPGKWFEFLTTLSTPNSTLAEISLLGSGSQVLENLTAPSAQACGVIFGLWPWQYTNCRHIEPMSMAQERSWQDYYLNDALIKLTQHTDNKEVMLRGIILRQNQQSRLPELFICTNIPEDQASIEDIARLYLSRWPNGKAGYEEFSRVIELFTYNASFRQPFPIEALMKKEPSDSDTPQTLFMSNLEILDAYVRWYFLPADYREMDITTTKNRFYSLRAQVRKKRDSTRVTFILPPGYAYHKALAYAIERLNERDIRLSNGSRLWFS